MTEPGDQTARPRGLTGTMLSDQNSVDTTQLWLLIAMIVAFVAGLIAVSRFEKKQE